MAERQNMADGVPTEAPQPAGEAAPGQGGVATLERPGTESEKPTISPEDRNRLQQAEAILGSGIQLISDKEETTDKGKAILRAHYEAAGEPGKDGNPASVGNYTIGQQLRKIRILKEAGFTREERDKLRVEGITGLDVPDYLKEAKEAKRTESQFEQLRKWVEEYGEKSIDMSRLTLAQRDEYERNLLENSLEMGELVNEAGVNGVLSFVIEDMQQVLDRIAPAPPPRRRRQSTYSDSSPEAPPKTPEEQIAYVFSILADYHETFWEYDDAVLAARFGTTDIEGIREKYQGVSRYIASKVAIALMKEIKGMPLDSRGEIGDFFLEEIQRRFSEKTAEAERQRRRQRRNATAKEILPYNTWREKFEFDWAENREELKMSVFVWLGKFIAHLPEATIEELHNEANTWKRNAIGSLEKAANDLGISEGEPFYKELKSTIEAYIGVLGGVKFLETDGGFEAYTTYLEEFAHNFNDKHDAIYLGNAKSAIILHFLDRAFKDPLNREYRAGAISLGAPTTLEKPQQGQSDAFRDDITEQAVRYAATHELYIRDEDFQNAILGEKEIRREVAALGLSPADSEKKVREILEVRRKENEERVRKGEPVEDRRYSWEDSIEDLLLKDERGRDAAKVATRTGVFKEIKERLDREDGLAGLSEDERKNVIRGRIKDKIKLAGKEQLLDEISRMTTAEADEALWKYVRDFNKKMISQGHKIWMPSAWDTVRLSIDAPTKLINRVLSEDEFEAMVEEVGLFKGVIGTTGVVVEIKVDGLTDEEIKANIDGLPDLSIVQKRELLEDALYNRNQREIEAEGALNIDRNYQKFLGADARWGGMVARDIGDDGEVVMVNIWEKAEEILKAKIDKEYNDIEAKVTAHETALRVRGGLTDAQIEEAKTERRRLLRRDATFGATLALREIGIANDLPIWNYYYYNDSQRIQAFAPLLGLTHNDKVEIVQILDRGRREMKAVFDYLADRYMDGKILVVQDKPNAGVDDAGLPKAYHKESLERARVINEASSASVLRDIFECRFMLSTSGAIEVVDLISRIADLGVYDLLWEMGCRNFREFQGFTRMRDEWELKKQSFWNIKEWRDPITWAKRVRGAGAAITFLKGGEVKGQGRVPGVLIEPMSGAWQYRVAFLEENNYFSITDRNKAKDETTALLGELIVANFPKLSRTGRDRLVDTGAKILGPLINYMDALRYKMNRAGLAPKNWKFDNEDIVDAYFAELLRRKEVVEVDSKGKKRVIPYGNEKLGDRHLAYAIQGRSPLAVKFYRDILQAASYHILSEAEREELELDKRGADAQTRTNALREAIEAEIVAHGLPPRVQAKIDARIAKLAAKNTSPEMQEREKEELKKQYINERVHKETLGEWPLRIYENKQRLAVLEAEAAKEAA